MHKYITSQTQIQINMITQMVYITAHKYTTSQTQIRISSCNIPVIGMRRTHMGTTWKWVNCQIGTAQTPQSSCKHHHVFLLHGFARAWALGLSPSHVCVFPPVCPSPSVFLPCVHRPRVLSDLRPNTWHSTHSRHFSEVKAVFETLKPSKGENTTKTKNAMSDLLFLCQYSLSVRIYIQFRN